jgi:hypothetical protein
MRYLVYKQTENNYLAHARPAAQRTWQPVSEESYPGKVLAVMKSLAVAFAARKLCAKGGYFQKGKIGQ